MKQDELFMLEALKEAKKAYEKQEVPVGCVIVKDNEIIARSHNQKESDQNVLHHAEIIAINQACQNLSSWRLDDCDIYVTLEPCLMCIGAIASARFKRLIFGPRDKKYQSLDKILQEYLKNFNHQVEVVSGILEKESDDLLKAFFKDLREKNK
ncbi:MAG: nucleoside deaminase [Candidatus Izemoplasmatales bacterium]|jgi:tRNA(adenine34) deaminase|nr:nucleoside deaminase [Candidatus Izemoplasmatales bacterium]MDD4068992.1 nucleoside deaminase [Candidatus Izemoplasmatales bacterium]MDY0138237.1 nucleoside deaminase [Candidatus Izemoplasmatales bacterium]